MGGTIAAHDGPGAGTLNEQHQAKECEECEGSGWQWNDAPDACGCCWSGHDCEACNGSGEAQE